MRRAAPLLLPLALACAVPPAGPAPSRAGWREATRFLDSLIADGVAPGAVLAVSVEGRHYYHAAGRLGLDDPRRPDSTTIYDLASVTKVVALTPAVILAVEEGKLALDSVVGTRSADSTHPGGAITLRQLLAHASGLPAWRSLFRETGSRADAIALARSTPLDSAPGAHFTYSDLGAIWMTALVEDAYGRRIDSLLAERVYGPLGLRDTRYLPPRAWRPRIAPTEDDPWRGRVLRGEVHDENAARLDGVSGHAGLFSSARDLLAFGDWMLARWAADSVVRLFTTRAELPAGSSRALGWDTPSQPSSGGTLISPRSFGHTGFTGTSIWVDPTRSLVIVLLTNRVHPSRANTRLAGLRGPIADRVVRAFPALRAAP